MSSQYKGNIFSPGNFPTSDTTTRNNIGKKAKLSTDDFINTAKVDGNSSPLKLDPQGRRGANYKNKDTGEMIKLGGKVLQVVSAIKIDDNLI